MSDTFQGEIVDRFLAVEQRVLSDLGDGKGNGNLWRNIKGLMEEDTKNRDKVAEMVRRFRDNAQEEREKLGGRSDALEKRCEFVEVKLSVDKDKIAALEEQIRQLAQKVATLQDVNEAQHRTLEGLSDRLNGRGLVQVEPYEKIVTQVRSISDQMAGGEGQLSYAQVRGSIQNTQYLGRILYGAIGLFGFGGVMAAGLTLFGVDKVPPEVQALQSSVQRLDADFQSLRTRYEQDLRDRLRGASK
jgi:outer membrane murein-binding lipoprotein Lpp